MKKKILSLCLVLALLAIAVVGATLAYFTDTDEATNVFVAGNVDIELVEQQRSEDGTALEDFEQEKVLMPIYGSAQGAKDQFGMPVAENYVDKIVSVNNIGNSDAYVRIFIATPAALDDPVSSDVPLHWNYGNKFYFDGTATGDANPDYDNVTVAYETTTQIDGVDYLVWSFTYEEVIPADASTKVPAIIGFYLDKNVDYDAARGVYTFKGNDIDFDLSENFDIPVFAQAVQAAGFATADEAFDEAGFTTNPWA